MIPFPASLRKRPSGGSSLRFMLLVPAFLLWAADIASAQITANITQPPLQTRAGSPITSNATSNQPVVLNVRFSSNGSAAAAATVTATLNAGSFTGNSTTTVITDADGNATFSNLVVTQAAVGYTLTFTANISGASSTANSAQFPIIAAAASNATLATAPGNATYGNPLNPSAVVRLTDVYGNPVANSNITASLNGTTAFASSNTSVPTDAAGNATFSNLRPASVGNFTVTFDPDASGVNNVTANVSVIPLATTLRVGNATINATSSFPPPGFVSSPVPSFTTTAFSQNVTDILGNFTYTTGNSTAVGNHTLSVAPGAGGTLANYTITYSNGTLTVTPGTPTSFISTAAPVTTEAGRPIEGVNLVSLTPQFPTFVLRDQFGNAVPGITINASLSSNPGNATLGGNTSVQTDGNGTALFNNLIITKAADGYRLDFSCPGLSPVTSAPFNIEPGAAGNITITAQPGNTTAGQTINGTTGGSPAVQVVDLFNNPVNSSYNIQATLINGTFTGTSITTVLTNSDGFGIFPALTTNQSGTYQIRFTPLAAGNFTANSANFTVAPEFSSANISIALQPGNSTAGQTINATTASGRPGVRIVDRFGNPVPGFAVNATLNGASFNATATTPSATTNATGNATFGALVTDTAGNFTLAFAFANATSASNSTTSSNFTVSPAAAAKLAIVVQPSASARAGIAIATQPAVRLQDAFSNNVGQTGIVVTASANGTGNGSAGGNPNATTDASGLATFSGLSINGTVGNYTLAFGGTGLTSVTSNGVSLSPGNPNQLSTSTQPPQTAMANATFSRQPVVQILDAWRNHVVSDNATVVSAVLNTGSLNATLAGTANATASSGNATFPNLRILGQVGNYTVTFNATGLSGNTSSSTNITPDLTTANLSVAIQPATATAGTRIAGSPAGNVTARVRDQFQNAIGNYTVNATLNTASFTSNSTPSIPTGADGNATFANLVTNTAGTFSLGFSFNASTPTTANSSTTSSNFTVNPAAANKLVMVSQPPGTVRAGVAFDNPNAPQVRLLDQFNNNVLQNGTLVTVAVGANATIGGNTAATTDPTGTAIFLGLSIGAPVGNYSLTFNATGLLSATSNSVAVTPGLPVKLGVASQPSTAAANATLSPQPSVHVLDAWNNRVIQDNTTVVSATLNNGTLSGTLAGTASATASLGNATFENLRILGQTGSYALAFNASGLNGTNSSNFTLTPDLLSAAISIAVQPGNSTAGAAISGPPTALVRDQFNNPIPGHTVNATLNTGNFTANSTRSTPTQGNGTAAFGNLVSNASGNYTIRFSFSQNGASGNATTSAFAVNAAAAAGIAITTQPSLNAQAGIALPQQPVVQLRDAFGNNAPSAGFMITATASGGATANGTTTAATNANGTATFSGLRLEGTAGNYTLAFGNGTLTGATSNSIALGAGSAAKLAISTQPGNLTQAGNAFNPQPAVRIQDAWNNNVAQAGTVVSASVTSGNATTGGNTTATSSANGTATFSGLTVAGTVGNYTLTFNSTMLSPVASNSVALAANPSTATISIVANATASVAGQTIQGPPTARIVDGSGNPLSGFTVNASINQNSGNFTGTRSATTNATGVAAFGNLTQTAAATGYRLTFSFSNGTNSGNATTANFTVGAAAAANMSISNQPKSWIAGMAIPGTTDGTFPAVQLRDAFNNAVPVQSISASLLGGNFAAGSNTTVPTDAGGNAAFNNLVVNAASTGYQIRFNGPNGTSALSGLFNIAPASVSKLILNNRGSLQSTAQFGVPLDPQPVIQLADAYNNPLRLANYTITATPNNGTVSAGGTAATDANGTATFGGLSLGGALGSRTLAFTSGTLENATSSAINLVAGPPAALAVVVQPATSFNAGDSLRNASYSPGSGPVARLLDAGGNPVASATVNATGGGFPAFGNGSNTTVTTDAGGNASFTNLVVFRAGNGLRVNFTAGNLSNATTAFNVEALPASSINITQQPPSLVFQNEVVSPNPSVALFDRFGNPASAPGAVSVTLNGGNFTGSNTTVSTLNGLGIFSNLRVATLGNLTMTFNATGASPATSQTFSVLRPGASGLNVRSITGTGGGNYTIVFSAVQGGTYWVQRATDLKLGPWSYTSANASTANTGNNTISVTTPGGSKAFWRLTTQKP